MRHRWVHTDPLKYLLAAMVGEGKAIGEHLGDRLQRERDIGVPGVVGLSVHKGQTDAELVSPRPATVGWVIALTWCVVVLDGLIGDRQVAAVQLLEPCTDLPADLG